MNDFNYDRSVYSLLLGSNIKSAREKAELTQKDLAETMNVSRNTISLWERGLSEPGAYQILRLCHALDCSADQLLQLDFDVEEMKPDRVCHLWSDDEFSIRVCGPAMDFTKSVPKLIMFSAGQVLCVKGSMSTMERVY